MLYGLSCINATLLSLLTSITMHNSIASLHRAAASQGSAGALSPTEGPPQRRVDVVSRLFEAALLQTPAPASQLQRHLLQ